MRLPFLRTKKFSSSEAVPQGACERKSRAFANAIDALCSRSKNRRVLDFGAACGENVDFFSANGCRLEILDLYPQLVERPDRLASTHEASAIQHLIGKILSERPGNDSESKTFDLLLTWDLFDFLSAAQVRGLVAGVEPYVSHGTRLLAQVSFLGTVPSEPRKVKIQDRTTLLISATEGHRTSPRYTEPQLLKVMPGWEVDHCYLQRSGHREYLFRRR